MPDFAEQILALELELLTRSVRASREQLERLLTDDFVEFGSSGAVYSKTQVMDELVAKPEPALPAPSVSDYRTRLVAPDVVLATYRCGASLRSSLWHRTSSGWRIAFHQGTPSPSVGPRQA